jgi:hypothetical protein
VLLLLGMTIQLVAGNNGLRSNIQEGVILHCFDWKLTDIKAEIPNIAKAGFSAVQTSPVSKGGSLGAVWYDVYRPQDYTIGNGIGSESELRDLCNYAHQYGVKVIVDVVANHTDYPNCTGYMNDKSRYHDPFDVSNWNDRKQVTHGKIGMWDNKTEDSGVQNYIHKFIEALKNCGVDGIRWDAAKHIGLPSEGDSFWQNVPDQGMYNYGEILDGTGGNDNSLFPEYQRYISITDNGYGNALAGSFNSGQVNGTIGNFNQRGASDNKLVYWGESHDTYANDGGSSKYISQNNIDRAYAVAAGNAYATTLYFSRPSSTNKQDMKIGQKGSTHFTAPEVAQVNWMHNICVGEPNYYVHTNDVGAQVRKNGAIIVLGSGGNRNVSVANGAGNGQWLKAGTYTDKVAGGTFTVTSSTISGQVGSTGIAVIYNGTVGGASVSLDPADGTSFSDETLTVKATADNATSAWIQVANQAKQSFTSLTSVTIGQGVSYGSSITISWGATGKDGKTVTGSATYNKVKAYVPYLDKKDEISCFLETSNDAAKIWAWNTTYNFTMDKANTETKNDWNNKPSMTLVGKAASGKNIFKWTYTGTQTDLPSNVIFTDGSGNTKLKGETDIIFKNHGYYVDGDFSKEITKVGNNDDVDPTPTPTPDPQPSSMNIYYNNPDNWSKVYCYFYDGTTSSSVWPGQVMNFDNSASYNGKTGWYKTSVPEGFENAQYVINDGRDGIAISGKSVTATTNAAVATPGQTSVAPSDPSTPDTPDPSTPDTPDTPTPQGSLDSQYATNPYGPGIKKTITVDGNISDWNSSMLIARGAANDDPRVYRPNSMYENPIDLYALYGCYDDNNLYLMWKMTNVQDVVAPNDNYPLSQGVLYQNLNCPVYIAINTGDSNSRVGNNGKLTTNGTLWDSGITISQSFNKIIAISYNGANGPFIYGGNSKGLNPAEEYARTNTGIVFKYGMGILENSVKGINGAYGTNNGRVPGDMTKNSTYVDFNSLGHNSNNLDFHFEMSIPLSKLGIIANDVATKGVGVLLMATMGLSPMDCLPYDLTCNDNADKPDTRSQENNSLEKSDADNFTVPFARIGK